MERDEDLTAPYAFQNKTWIAFEDKISVGIKVCMRISQLPTLRENSVAMPLFEKKSVTQSLF